MTMQKTNEQTPEIVASNGKMCTQKYKNMRKQCFGCMWKTCLILFLFFSSFSILRISFSKSGTFSPNPDLSFNARSADTVGIRPFAFPLNPERLAIAIKCQFKVPRGRLLIGEVEFENGEFFFSFQKKNQKQYKFVANLHLKAVFTYFIKYFLAY